MVTNPLSARARGIIYVTAIVIGAVSLVATAILNVVNLEQWVSVVAAAASAADNGHKPNWSFRPPCYPAWRA